MTTATLAAPVRGTSLLSPVDDGASDYATDDARFVVIRDPETGTYRATDIATGRVADLLDDVAAARKWVAAMVDREYNAALRAWNEDPVPAIWEGGEPVLYVTHDGRFLIVRLTGAQGFRVVDRHGYSTPRLVGPGRDVNLVREAIREMRDG